MPAPIIVPMGTENIRADLFGVKIKKNKNESFT